MPVDPFWYGTLADMIDQDILDHGFGQEGLTNGFSIGKKGTAKFWMYNPVSASGLYKIYQQNEDGKILGVRYVDANKTFVTVHKK